jgi:hypothetical protein
MIEPSVKTLLEGLAALRDLIACHDSERASALCEELLALGVKAAEVANVPCVRGRGYQTVRFPPWRPDWRIC